MSKTDEIKVFLENFEKAYEQCMDERKSLGVNDYNIFDVLDIENKEKREVKHSKFLWSLLDPNGLHYRGNLFLREFIKVCAPSSFELDASKAKVYREHNYIDIYITDDSKHIIIENKLWTHEHDSQIKKYIDFVVKEKHASYENILVLYLTPFECNVEFGDIDKIEANHLKLGQNQVAFRHITYKNEILEWIGKIKAKTINLSDLNIIISQYEKAVKKLTKQGEKMNDTELQELIMKNYSLCKKIANILPETLENFIKKLSESLNKEPEEKRHGKWWDAILIQKDGNKYICIQIENENKLYCGNVEKIDNDLKWEKPYIMEKNLDDIKDLNEFANEIASELKETLEKN